MSVLTKTRRKHAGRILALL